MKHRAIRECGAIRNAPAKAGIGLRATVLRMAGALAATMIVAGCDVPPDATQRTYSLPASTPVISASAERARQLTTTSAEDDIPEYTGAPGPNGELPSYVPLTRTTVFDRAQVRIVR
ncbi:hypothetical protein [Tropicimonas sp.]|uniref:hypothetical protein n=1 Tax=Tropicimonas sp. TaxID=2067044 RepID=UPI003A871869